MNTLLVVLVAVHLLVDLRGHRRLKEQIEMLAVFRAGRSARFAVSQLDGLFAEAEDEMYDVAFAFDLEGLGDLDLREDIDE